MKRLFRRGCLTALVSTGLALGVMSGVTQAAPGEHTQTEVNGAVEKGVAYLDTQQNEDGSYGTSEPVAETGMTLVAYSVLDEGKFSNLSGSYQEHVKKAIAWLLTQQSAEGAFGSSYLTYDTGTALAGLQPFEAANAGVAGAIASGRKFLEGEFQGTAFTGCSSEEGSETASYCGGWNYDKEAGRSDESNTGFAMFGMHQSGGVPAAIAGQNVGWQHHVQAIKSNPFSARNDGGAGYEPQCASGCSSFSSNANDTGSLLFGLGYDGVSLTNEGVKAGIKFGEDILNEYELEKEVSRTMVYHVGVSEDGTCKIGTEGCDWAFGSGEGGYHYSLFALTKGLGEYVEPKLKEAGNWYAKVVDLLLTQQEKAGSWPADLRDDAGTVFATALSVSSLGLIGVESKVTTTLSGEDKTGEKITVKEGSAVTDSATLNGTEIATAKGTVTYNVYSDNECTKLVANAGTVTVSGGTAPASTAETLPPGTYFWQAAYSGDGSHEAASSRCIDEQLVVEKAEGTGPKPTTTSTSLSGGGKSGATITVPEGTAVTDQATLGGTNVASATGTVNYRVYSDKACTIEVANAGAVPVSGGAAPPSEAKTLEPGKTYYWQASYGGDTNNEASSSECGSEVETVERGGPPPPTCTTAVGFATVVIRKEGETERQKVMNKLSTNLAAKQKLTFTWEAGASKLALTNLTSASCTVKANGTKKFQGKGQATVNGDPGWNVSFYFTLSTKNNFVFHIRVSKPKEEALAFRDRAAMLTSEKIS